MDALTTFGFLAVTSMFLCDMMEKRRPWFTLFFGIACWAGAFYAFLQQSWPFFVVEALWGCMKIYHWSKWYRQHVKNKPHT